MYIRFLSWRFLKARRTNIIGITGIFVGVGALILILSIMTGFLEQNRIMVRGTLSDVIIAPIMVHAMGQERPVPREPEPILAELRTEPRIQAACAHLVWFGILGQSGRGALGSELDLAGGMGELSGISLVGIDIENQFRATALHDALTREIHEDHKEHIEGSRVTEPDDPFAYPLGYEPDGKPLPPCLVGEKLAVHKGLRKGSVVEFVTALPNPRTGEIRTEASNLRFLVAGTFRTGEHETDLGRIYVQREVLAEFVGTRSFSQILVKLNDYDGESEELVQDLRSTLSEKGLIYGGTEAQNEVRTWEEFRATLIGAIENERVLMAIMLSLVLVVAGFTVFAILSMMVTEKRRDIGIICALGATPRGILWLFLSIAFWDVLLGALLGVIFGIWGALRIDAIEQGLSNALGIQIFNRDIYLFDHIPAVVDPKSVCMIVLGAVVCTLLFAAIPAWKAARLHPLDALRYE